MPRTGSQFAFAAGVVLEVRGSRAVHGHFAAEYGSRAVAGAGEPSVVVEFGRAVPARTERYKSVHWRVALGDPAERPLRAWIEVGGRPLRFAFSFLQGYVVEPLVAVAAARAGYLLLPAAAVETDRGVALLLGRSRSGKSSLCARALAAGRRILGDDHVLLDREGRCRAFPRRLRLYPDLDRTAPAAFRRLPREARFALRLRAAARMVTRGYLSPPLRLPVDSLGRPFPADPLPLTHVLAIRPSVEGGRLERRRLSPQAAVELAEANAEEQRARLARDQQADSWRETLAATKAADRALLEAAFRDAPAEEAALPSGWTSVRAISALAELLGVDRDPRPAVGSASS